MNRRGFFQTFVGALAGIAFGRATAPKDNGPSFRSVPDESRGIIPPASPPRPGATMKVGDPGWMHPSSPVAQRLHEQYLRGTMSAEPGVEYWYRPLPPEIAEAVRMRDYLNRQIADYYAVRPIAPIVIPRHVEERL